MPIQKIFIMIPKIIHYSWFSTNPKPEYIQKFMATWQPILTDYEFILWDMQRLKEVNSLFANEAISVGKWAFAADYIRLYAIYNYGGIWLDTDVEIFKSFDPFLKNKLFIGRESWIHKSNSFRYLTAHAFGAIKKHPFIKDCLEYYKNKNFIKSDDESLTEEERFDMRIIPEIMMEVALKYGYNPDASKDIYQLLDQDIHVYPSWYFCRPEFHSIDKVFCIHRCAASWRSDRSPDFSFSEPKKLTLKIRIKRILQIVGFLSQD